MKIQIVTFAGVPDHIYCAEKHFKTERLVLILSNENNDEFHKGNTEFIGNINEVTEFYEKLKIPVAKIYVNYKNFMEMTFKLAEVLNQIETGDEVLLNLSGGRRSMPISLIYAGTFVSNFKDIKIQCVVIPEDQTYEPFNLLPNYLPDQIDINLISKLSEQKTLTELEEYLGIKQPTISMRLKRLEKHGFINIDGRTRKITDMGNLVVDINKNINDIEESSKITKPKGK